MYDFHGQARRLKNLHERYERFVFPVALVIGFVFDFFLFGQININTAGVVLFGYFILIILTLTVFHFFDWEALRARFASGEAGAFDQFLTWLPTVLQYTFGALFSAFVVFYLQSASLAGSFFFIMLLVLALVASEVFRKHYFRLDFQISFLFAALFLYLFFVISVISGKVGTLPFVLSSLAALVLTLVLLAMLRPLIAGKMRHFRYSLFAGIGGIFVAVNGLYFTGFVPPVPLVLKDVGVYHSVERLENGAYAAEVEQNVESGFDLFSRHDERIRLEPGKPVFFYSAIYAPRNVNTEIFHEWEFYDPARGQWVTRDQIAFAISGGREAGYRGYTTKENLSEGHWRVNIITGDGSTLGRVEFSIQRTQTTVPTEIKRL